ncbi:MAG: AmmeMemoRadiSam system radical SAM enzyme, partial [Clostridiales bacterium]
MSEIITKTAEYWEPCNDKIRCTLCPHQCLIGMGKAGLCLGRKNIDGKLIAENYGRVTSMAVDPMTKKPLNRFYAANTILTVASYGCNFKCNFCQNHSISQQENDYTYYSPKAILDLALHHTINDNVGLAFSYNEPTISFEYVKDCFKLIKAAGLKTILVTNGYLAEKPFGELAALTDAMNIDLKGFNENFYHKICGGDLETVKKNITTAVEHCHVEITTLVIPQLNDDLQEIKAMAKWIGELNPEIPYHLSRFFPRYKMENQEPTPLATMSEAAEVASEYLKYVYLGNM